MGALRRRAAGIVVAGIGTVGVVLAADAWSPTETRNDARSSPRESSISSVRVQPETAGERFTRLLPTVTAARTSMEPGAAPPIERRLLRQIVHDGHAGLFTERPNGFRPVAIVMHATGSGRTGSEFASLEALGGYFQRTGVAASHFAVDRSGRIMQYVREDRAAFHVSKPGWNGISIGIELLNDNTGVQPFPTAQVRSARQLVQHLGDRYSIPVEAVVRHRDIQPEDRSDPAANFDWTAFTGALADVSGAATRPRRTAEGSQRLDAR